MYNIHIITYIKTVKREQLTRNTRFQPKINLKIYISIKNKENELKKLSNNYKTFYLHNLILSLGTNQTAFKRTLEVH